jgi:hypothetical protein
VAERPDSPEWPAMVTDDRGYDTPFVPRGLAA